jgi:hypothetical protein
LLQPFAAKTRLMRAFDPAELRDAGVDIHPLPDERGHLIDPHALPSAFADYLEREGLDTSRSIRVVGVIGRRPDGRPDRYTIHFRQD